MLGYKLRKINSGKNFHKNFFEIFGRTIPMTIICEDLPEISNYVELDHENQDSIGMPGVKIKYTLGANTKNDQRYLIDNALFILYFLRQVFFRR